MRKSRGQLTLLMAATAFGQMTSSLALAQQAAQSTAGAGQLEEIVVTAQKRSEDLTKVPASISVLSGAALQEQHIENFQDITRVIPGVSFNAGATVSGGPVGPGTTNINIRGISSVAGSATVSVYMDEVSITQGNLYDGAAEPKFLDFDRLEVLRGPQGTLFGASSMGGNLRFISKKVDLQSYSGDVNADLSGTDHGDVNYSLDATVNLPVVPDKLGLRFSAQSGYNSGYIDHFNPNGDGQLLESGTNTERWTAFRFTSKLQVDDTLSATLAMFYQHDHTADTPVFYPQIGTFNQDKPVKEPITDNVFIPSLTIEKDFDSFTLTSATGFFQRDFNFQDDGTVFNSLAVAQFFLDPFYPQKQAQNDTILGTIPSPVHRDDRTWQESEEVRLTSKDATLFGNAFNWIAGFYFENQRQARDDFEPAPGFRKAFLDLYGFPIQLSKIGNAYQHSLPGNANLPYISYAQDLLYGDNQWLDQQQYAVFAQADYNITPDLKGTVGMRYEYATQNYFRNSFGILSFGNVFPFTAQTDTYAFTPKFSLEYTVNDEVSVYGTISKGFRLGGPTGPVASSVCGDNLRQYGISSRPTKYGPDKLWSYEAGAKSRLLDNRVTVNADAFYIEWDNIQQQINLPECGASITQNFGAAESYGTEFEIHALVTPELTLGLGGDVTRTVITESPNPQTAQVGQDVLNVPKYTFAFSADYDFPINDEMDGFIRADYHLVGSSKGAFSNTDPAYNEPSYGVVNGSLGVTTGPYEVSLYGKNLGNNQKIIQRPAINFTSEGYTLRPLTVGLRGSMKF